MISIFEYPYQQIAIMLIFVGIGAFLEWFIHRYLVKWSEKTSIKFDDIIVNALRVPIFLWVLLAGFYVVIQTTAFPKELIGYIDVAIYVLLVLSISIVIANILANFVKFYGRKLGVSAIPLTTIGQNMVRVGVLFIGFMILLDGLGISISPLLASMGIAGLAIALALQDTLSNLFSGLYVMIDKPIRIGDYIKLDTGDEGYVEDIGWRSTRIKMLPNNLIIIPNQKLSQSIITNYFLPEKRMAFILRVGVGYDSDPDEVERILIEETTKAAGEVKGLLSEPAPFVRFSEFGEYALIFSIICQVEEFVSQYYVGHELRKRIYKRFREEEITIPFPIRTIHLSKDEDAIDSQREDLGRGSNERKPKG